MLAKLLDLEMQLKYNTNVEKPVAHVLLQLIQLLILELRIKEDSEEKTPLTRR